MYLNDVHQMPKHMIAATLGFSYSTVVKICQDYSKTGFVNKCFPKNTKECILQQRKDYQWNM